MKKKNHITRWTLAFLCGWTSAHAADVAGLEVNGYSRGGGVFNYNKDQQIKGGLTLGGDLQKFRLGNEGDYGVEVNIAKTFDAGNGVTYKLNYMPSKWNGDNVGTEQAYVELSGLDFAPEAKVWAGQHRQRIQDIHIVDHFLMDYGVNQGVGFTDLAVGSLKLGAALQTGDTFDKKMAAGTSANKFNLDLSNIVTNPGGKLRVLLTSVSTSGLASQGGHGLSVSHNQSDFLAQGVTHSVFAQTASGYANINGRFGDISSAAVYGKKSSRVVDSIQWQRGRWGGQALIGYQTTRSDNPAQPYTVKDTTLGGRVAYAYTQNFKLLVEAGTTGRSFSDQQASQRLNKLTIAPTLAVNSDFWSRPELRFYVTRANWNDAAALANAGANNDGFSAYQRRAQTLAGVQYEVWW
jgi:maltoporin